MNGTTVDRFGAAGLSMSTGLPAWLLKAAVWAGIVVGATYVLSPLSVIVGLALIPLFRWAGRDLPAEERRRVHAMLAAAVLLRVLAIAVLMVTANHDAGTFAKFFGDEEFYQLRGLRLYNIQMGIPVSMESFLYAYDKTGASLYQSLLVYVHLLVGPAPYGVHLLNSFFYLFGVVLLYRVARRAYGPVIAGVGTAALLFLPSLFMWSVSALRESPFLTVTAVTLVAAMWLPRARSVAAFILAAATIWLGVLGIEALRPGGLLVTLAGIALGYLVWLSILRRTVRWLVAAAVLVFAVSLIRSGLPTRIEDQLNQAARYHRGHVLTPGHSYRVLDQRYYSEFWGIDGSIHMDGGEATRYVIRAVVNYVAQPLPWNIVSKFELAYMPELAVWLVLVALFPIGFIAAVQRDALSTCILGGYTVMNGVIIALNSGNVGTLVRHRALVVPYMVWISAAGLIALLRQGANNNVHH
jgi:hypothetical protein